jgi:hypothetical protein
LPGLFPDRRQIDIKQSNMAAIWKQQMSSGGAERDRTADPLLAKQVLSQLSYSPTWVSLFCNMVGLGRFELPTSPLSGVRSNQLSYRPVLAGSRAGSKSGGSNKTSFSVKRVSRTRLNMLGSYASRDHRANAIKQRRLVSGFPRSPSGTAVAGWTAYRLDVSRRSAFAEGVNMQPFLF